MEGQLKAPAEFMDVVLVGEHDPTFVEFLVACGFNIVSRWPNCESAAGKIHQLNPDYVVIDLDTELTTDKLQPIHLLRISRTKVFAISSVCDWNLASAVLQNGGNAFLLKPAEDFVQAAHACFTDGSFFISRTIVEEATRQCTARVKQETPVENTPLTAREQQIVELLQKDWSRTDFDELLRLNPELRDRLQRGIRNQHLPERKFGPFPYRSKRGLPVPDDDRLTLNERRICIFLLDGKSSEEIATIMGITVEQVLAHSLRAMRKLNLKQLGDQTESAE